MVRFDWYSLLYLWSTGVWKNSRIKLDPTASISIVVCMIFITTLYYPRC